ncbi:HERC2 [Symbiodinium necroappetens]|uniref:HERC2 protein n=1 Tax=Symbiodinium necroappetens TaxID=1628268 RepID=A0A812QJ65_9DINO|nr:HERC2 [Symbiodinium necroappetens]
MSPPSPQRRLSGGTCRRYRVPLDYSQGLAGGNIIVTVKRSGPATKSDGQLWIMQGGPGMPSHPMLGLLAGLGKVSYALDHRGTGWSTVLDCPKVRSKQPGKLPCGNSWMKGLGFGNVSTETVDACLASGDIGAPKHFTAANAARDLASVIVAIQAETGSTADGQEFPVIVSHVGIDGVCGGDYDFGQFALAANRAGQRLLDEYCDAGCRGKLGAPATGSVALWFGEAVKEIDKAFFRRWFGRRLLWEVLLGALREVVLSVRLDQASAKDALGSIGYLHFSGGFSLQKQFVTLVLTLRRCVRDTSATTIPSDFWAVVHSIDDAVRRVEDYRQNNPTEFSEILHLVVSFGDLWKGPPELHAWGLEDARHGNCSLASWRDFFDEHVFWAPDFVTLMSRYQDVFNKYGYRENSALVHSNGHPWSNVTVLVTNGDLDGQTPLRSARATFEALPTCKAKVELPTGGHCVSGSSCLGRVVAAFYRSPVACSSGSVAPATSSALGKALEAFDSGSCKARKILAGWWTGLLPVRGCGRNFTGSGCDTTQRFCSGCFSTCVRLLEKASVPNARCVCAAEAARCGARGNCTEGGFEFCSQEASQAGCDHRLARPGCSIVLLPSPDGSSCLLSSQVSSATRPVLGRQWDIAARHQLWLWRQQKGFTGALDARSVFITSPGAKLPNRNLNPKS